MELDFSLTWSVWLFWIFVGIFICRQLLLFAATEVVIWEQKHEEDSPLAPIIKGILVIVGLVRFILPIVVVFDNWKTAVAMLVLDAVAGFVMGLLLRLWTLLRVNPKTNRYLGTVVAIVVALAGILGVATLSTFIKDCRGRSTIGEVFRGGDGLSEQEKRVLKEQREHPILRTFHGQILGVTDRESFLSSMSEQGYKVTHLDNDDDDEENHPIERYIVSSPIGRSNMQLFSFMDDKLFLVALIMDTSKDYEEVADSLRKEYEVYSYGIEDSDTYTDFTTMIVFNIGEDLPNSIAFGDSRMNELLMDEDDLRMYRLFKMMNDPRERKK